MSNAVPQTSSWRSHWWVGALLLTISIITGLTVWLNPQWTNRFSIPGVVGIRLVIVLVGVVGLVQLATAWSPTRGAISTPGFGKHRMVIPVEGIVYLAIIVVLLIGAMLTKSNMLLLVFALMAGPFVINGWMTFGMLQAARVSRSAPCRAMVGELFAVELSLANSRPLTSIWIMSVRDTIHHVSEELKATVLFARVAPRSAQTGHYQLRLMRRGRYRLGPLLAFSRFPLGLVERSRLFPIAGEILVYPRIGRLSSNWRRRWLSATELIARPQPHSGVFHDEFHRLREFRTGDNPRDIHWRTSARRGELILREYQQNRDFNLAVVLDLWVPDAAVGKPSELVERALSFATTILVEHGRMCRDAVLTLGAAGGTTFRWQGQGTSASLESLFDGLAVLEAGPAKDTKMLLEVTQQTLSTSTQIVLLTTRPHESSVHFENLARVDIVRLAEIDLERVMVFDDDISQAPRELRFDDLQGTLVGADTKQ